MAGTAFTRAYDIHAMSGMTAGYSILALTAAVLVTGMALADAGRNPLARALSWAPLRSCGKYSYAMYVFHVPLHKLVGTPLLATLHGPQSRPAQVALYAVAVGVVSYLLAVLSWHGFEKHWLALKGRFAPRPAPA
jgi:peptidoglycan/LPS O-acetylase OafA/YrhL